MKHALDKILNNNYFDILYYKNKHYYFFNKRIGLHQNFSKSSFTNRSLLFLLAPMTFWIDISKHKNGRAHIKNCADLLSESFNINKGADMRKKKGLTFNEHLKMAELLNKISKELYPGIATKYNKTDKVSNTAYKIDKLVRLLKCDMKEKIFVDCPFEVKQLDEKYDKHRVLKVYYGDSKQRMEIKHFTDRLF